MKYRPTRFVVILLSGLIVGTISGIMWRDKVVVFKPLGDLFLNMLFVVVVPLVFFSISSALAQVSNSNKIGSILGWMMTVFVSTGIMSSVFMIAGILVFPPETHLATSFAVQRAPVSSSSLLEKIVDAITVSDFSLLFSRSHMLSLIVFALLVGFATARAGEKGKAFAQVLSAGAHVMGKVVSYVMWYAPIGLGAYAAYLVGTLGPELFSSYSRAMGLYYVMAVMYFIVGFTCYAAISGGKKGMLQFWKYIFPAAFTAWGTGSSVASIPVTMESARRIGIPNEVREVIVPIGATIHMEGSCMAAMIKIAVLFSIFHMDFSGIDVFLMAIGIAVLSGVVISGIPSGGMIGEMLIITLYGFPVEALPLITVIGTLVDPPATMINATGDCVSSMLVSRIMYGKKWMRGH